MKVFKKRQSMIESVDDLVSLNIIDFGRHNGGLFGGPHRAIEAIASLTVGSMVCTVFHDDLRQYPMRNDFPEWRHVGNHEEIAQLYWNKFCFQFPESTLQFQDAPDFTGVLRVDGYENRFWGDIGQVSSAAFYETLLGISPGDLWISVVGDRQVILEAQLVLPILVGYQQDNMFKGSVDDSLEGWRQYCLQYGYDPMWNTEEYQRAYRIYLDTHCRLDKSYAPNAVIQNKKKQESVTGLYQSFLF